MEYRELIAARHSVRKFSSRKIDRSVLEEIVREAELAPSSKNSHSSSFRIVDDPEALNLMASMRDSGSRFVAGASAAIVVLGDITKTDLWVDNASISATYIMLSATDRGIGNCWVHVNGRPQVKAEPEKGTAEDYLRALLKIENQFRPLCIIALGYPED